MIELLVGLSIVAILLSVGVPAISGLIKDNRLLAQSYTVRAALNQARSEAMAQRAYATVCGVPASPLDPESPRSCQGNWNQGFAAFVVGRGSANIGTFTSGRDTHFLFHALELPTGSQIRVNTPNFDSRFIFSSRGYAYESGSVVFCDDRGPSRARGLIISPSGVVASAIDTNGNGVINLLDGRDATCGLSGS